MAAGRLTVEVTADTVKLDQGLKKVEGTLKDTGKTLDDEMNTPLGKVAVKAGKLFAAMGAIEGATKLASTAISGMQGLFASLNGDASAAEQAFAVMAATAKSLPFGIGPVVSAFEQILHISFGLNEEIARQEEMTKRLADLNRQIAESKARQEEITSLQTSVKLMTEKDALNRADIEYMATFLKLQEEHDKRMEAALGKSMKEQARIFKDSEKRKQLEQELARLRMEAALETENERRELETIRRLEQERLEVETKKREEKREALLLLREEERLERKRLTEMKRAAREIKKIQDEERKQKQDAATATSSANTAMGTFKFGQVRTGGGQEKANAHLQEVEAGIKQLIQLISVGIRGIGFV